MFQGIFTNIHLMILLSGEIICSESYQLFLNGMNFRDAKNLCEKKGQQLAYIKSVAELDDVKSYLKGLNVSIGEMYIGLVWDSTEQQHKWLDNQILSWLDWALGEPNCMSDRPAEENCISTNEDCVRILTDFRFRTADCGKEYNVLCGSVGLPTTTVNISSPTSTTQSETIAKNEMSTTVITTEPPTTVLFKEVKTKTWNEVITDSTTKAEQSVKTTITGETSALLLRIVSSKFSSNKLTTNVTWPPSTIASSIQNGDDPSASISFIYTSTQTSNKLSANVYHSFSTAASSKQNGDGRCVETAGLDCMCPWYTVGSKWMTLNNPNLTFDELKTIVVDEFEKNIKPYILVDTHALSKTIRRKKSAPDNRTSSSSLGWFSVVIIAIPISIIVSIDCILFCKKKNT